MFNADNLATTKKVYYVVIKVMRCITELLMTITNYRTVSYGMTRHGYSDP